MQIETTLIALLFISYPVLLYFGRKFKIRPFDRLELIWIIPMVRTDRFQGMMGYISEKMNRPLSVWKELVLPLEASCVIAFFYIMTRNLISFIVAPARASLILPMVPGLSLGLDELLYLLPGISLGASFHEIAHGLAALNEKIKVESVGIAFLPIFPSFFVELNEEQFLAHEPRSRAQVASSGPAINMLLFLAFLFILVGLFSSPDGAYIDRVTTPASRFLKVGDVITYADGTRINGREDLMKLIDKKRPGEVMALVTRDGRSFNVTLTTNPNNETAPFLGIFAVDYFGDTPLSYPDFNMILYRIVSWATNINFSLAVINSSPIFFLDGEKVTEAVSEMKGIKVHKALSYLSVLLLLANISFSVLSLGL